MLQPALARRSCCRRLAWWVADGEVDLWAVRRTPRVTYQAEAAVPLASERLFGSDHRCISSPVPKLRT